MLDREIAIFMKDSQFVAATIELHVHTNDHDIKAFKVESVDVIADFQRAYTDQYIVTAYFTPSAAILGIVTRRKHLEMTILKTTTAETFRLRMKAVIPEPYLDEMEANAALRNDAISMDKLGLVKLELHGKPAFAEAASTLAIGGNYLNTSLDALMSKVIKFYMEEVRLAGGVSLDEVVISPINNTKVFPQALVPSGTPLLILPRHLQEKYGMYPSAIGSYLRPFEDGRKVWWIFPQYGNININVPQPRLKILVCYDRRADVIKGTIQRDGNILIIIAQLVEKGNQVQDNRPHTRNTSVNVVDMDRVIESPVSYKEGEVMVSGNDRYKSLSVYSREDSVDTPAPYTRRTSNLYTATAAVSANETRTLMFQWNNGMHELITPGMVAEVVIDRRTYIESGYGRVGQLHSVSARQGNLAAEAIHTETVMFSVSFTVRN